MKLLQLMRREATISFVRMLLVIVASGVANALILVTINMAAATAAAGDSHSMMLLIMFIVTMVLFTAAQSYIFLTSVAEVENVLHRIRIRIADKIRQCDLLPIEHTGRADIYAVINNDTLTISQSVPTITNCYQSVVLIVFALLYVAWLSLTALVINLICYAVAVFIIRKRLDQAHPEQIETKQRENEMFDSISSLLDGFKEIKMSADRSADLFEDIDAISHSVTVMKSKSQTEIHKTVVLATLILYLQLGAIVFFVPIISASYGNVVAATAAVVLFLTGAILGLIGNMVTFANSNIACERIDALEAKLDQFIDKSVKATPAFRTVQKICLRDVTFSYNGTERPTLFTVGPLDLTIAAGEIVFITGGNGSGKSTFIKLLTGLYPAQKGYIQIDQSRLRKSNYEAYRNLFSVIFSDHHLFRRLYGLGEVDEQHFYALLQEMDLAGKIDLVDGEFDTLDLSDGQKKRLALLVCLLEEKPILVFDEWAAHQDPDFKKKFYHELLPELKQQGKTIVAVTHDDRYFSTADRVLKMENGRFIDELK